MLYCGSYSYLKDNLKNILLKKPKGEKLTFLVHTNQMKIFLKEYLTKELGILVNSEFFTLIDISKKLSSIEPLQDFDKELILKKILYDKGYKLDGLPKDFNLLLQYLKEYEIPLGIIKSGFIKNVIHLYEKFKGSDYFDREDIHKKAIEVRTDFSTDNLIVFGIKSVPILHQKLIRKLKTLSKNIYVFLPYHLDSGYYQNYPHFKETVAFFEKLTGQKNEEKTEVPNISISKLIYNFKYSTTPIENSNIEIVKTNSELEEVEFVAEKISRLVINEKYDFSNIGVVIPNIETYLPFIKETFSKYKVPYYLIEENRYIDELLFKKLFALFQLKEKNFSKDAILNFISDKVFKLEKLDEFEEKIILSPIKEGFKELKEYIFNNENFKDIEELFKVLNNFPENAEIDYYIEKFEYINQKFIKDERTKNFLSNIFEDLKNTKLYKNLFNKISYEEFVSVIKTFFEKENKENRIKGNTVLISTPILAEANNFDVIFFLNLNSGNYPSTLKDEALISSLKSDGFDYPYYILMQELLTFSNLLDKNKKVYLSFITNSIFSSEKAPSILIEELKRLMHIEDIDLKLPSKEYTLKDFKVKYAKQIKSIDNQLKEKWERYEKINNPKIEDFKLNKVEVKFPISPTKFSAYAYCPYKFYLEHILEIDEMEEPDRTTISALEKGVLVHNLLEKFYKNLDLNSNSFEKDIHKLENEYNQKIQELLKFIIPSYRPFENYNSKILIQRLKSFIKKDIERLKKQQRKVAKELLEKEFKNKYFRGRIDRVDKDNAENYYIYDYKTGEKPVKDIEKEAKDKYIQLIIYKDFLEEENKKVKEIGIFAVNDENNQCFYPLNKEDTFKELKTYLDKLLNRLREKYFYPLENDFCKYCQFNDFCVKDKLNINQETDDV